MDSLELIDVLDPYTLEKTGEVQTREQIYKDGKWHAVFHLWVVNTEKKSLYIQKRSSLKLFSKNLLDVTVGGTIRHGEQIKDGVREIHEELQWEIPYKDLSFLERRYHPLREDRYFNNQISYVFLYLTNQKLKDIKFNKEEIDGLFEIPFAELNKIFSSSNYQYLAEGLTYRCRQYQPDKLHIKKTDFVPSIDNYPCRIIQYANQHLNNLNNEEI